MLSANNLRRMFISADSLYTVMSKAPGSNLLALSVLLQACDAAGLNKAAVQLVWATYQLDSYIHSTSPSFITAVLQQFLWCSIVKRLDI